MRKAVYLSSLGLAFSLGLCCHRLVPEASAASPQRVTGIGGIFFKARDPVKLKAWYSQHLGLNMNEHGTSFEGQTFEGKPAHIQWSTMPATTKYFEPSRASFMINYRVADLKSLLPILKSEGVTIVDKLDVESYGLFVHILDPEGNKIELYEPIGDTYLKDAKGRTR